LSSLRMALVDSPNSWASPFKYPLLVATTKNLISNLNLVLEVISVSNNGLDIKLIK